MNDMPNRNRLLSDAIKASTIHETGNGREERRRIRKSMFTEKFWRIPDNQKSDRRPFDRPRSLKILLFLDKFENIRAHKMEMSISSISRKICNNCISNFESLMM